VRERTRTTAIFRDIATGRNEGLKEQSRETAGAPQREGAATERDSGGLCGRVEGA